MGGGGDIDNDCNNYLTSEENNSGHNMDMNYHNVVYDQSKVDVCFNSGVSMLCNEISGFGCGQVDGCSGNIPVNADFYYFDQNVVSKNVASDGNSADNSHTLNTALAKLGGVGDSVLTFDMLGDYKNAMQVMDCHPSYRTRKGHSGAIQGLFRVDFTSFTHFNWFSNKRVCIVSVHNSGHQGRGKFYYLVGGASLAVAELVPCDMVPTGEICISHSRVMNIIISDVQRMFSKDLYDSVDLKLTWRYFERCMVN